MEKDKHLDTVKLLSLCMKEAETQKFVGAVVILVLKPDGEHVGEGAQHIFQNIPELEAVAHLEHAKYFLLRDM